MVKVTFHLIRNCSFRKEFAPSGSKFFPLREVPISKRDAIDDACNQCLIQYSPFDGRNFSVFWLRHWYLPPMHIDRRGRRLAGLFLQYRDQI